MFSARGALVHRIISPYLPISPHISPYLPESCSTAPHQARCRARSPRSRASSPSTRTAAPRSPKLFSEGEGRTRAQPLFLLVCRQRGPERDPAAGAAAAVGERRAATHSAASASAGRETVISCCVRVCSLLVRGRRALPLYRSTRRPSQAHTACRSSAHLAAHCSIGC